MKTELWLGHKIRFVEKDGEWWAVLSDVAEVLKLRTDKIAARLEKDNLSKVTLETAGGRQKVSIINEFGIYEAVFESRKPEAKDFKRWVFNVIKTLRQSTGLEGFQVFRMMDKEHQKAAMKKLCDGLDRPVRVDFIKANTIANKAVSTRYGHPKMLKKNQMTPQMLADRENVLADTVNLMVAKDSFGADWSVAEMVYAKHAAHPAAKSA